MTFYGSVCNQFEGGLHEVCALNLAMQPNQVFGYPEVESWLYEPGVGEHAPPNFKNLTKLGRY